jgi:hypothetical protein
MHVSLTTCRPRADVGQMLGLVLQLPTLGAEVRV